MALSVLAASCSSPWNREPVAKEVNFAFTMDGNLMRLDTVRLDNRPGRFLLGTAAPQSIVDPQFPLRRSFGRHVIQISEKQTLRIQPAQHDLRGVADAIIGSEAWGSNAISIDYRSGLVTYQKDGIRDGLMNIYRYDAAPKINVMVDGRAISAIVDTTSPDTLVLPGPSSERRNATVTIGSTDFGTIDVQYANVAQARIGNRLLSHFLVTIDYGQRVVGLWRDPRTPLAP